MLSNYLKQLWPSLLTHTCVTWPRLYIYIYICIYIALFWYGRLCNHAQFGLFENYQNSTTTTTRTSKDYLFIEGKKSNITLGITNLYAYNDVHSNNDHDKQNTWMTIGSSTSTDGDIQCVNQLEMESTSTHFIQLSSYMATPHERCSFCNKPIIRVAGKYVNVLFWCHAFMTARNNSVLSHETYLHYTLPKN